MSFSLDANLLLYASDSASPHHDAARSFVGQCTAGPELLYLGWPTIMAYLRIATHGRVFDAPLSPAEAKQNIEALLARPHVRLISEKEGFWATWSEVTANMVVRGTLVPDAHLAALLKQHGVRTFYTNDWDFLRFDFLNVRFPLA